MHRYHVIAIDLGASSGRMILGGFDGKTLSILDEYRMQNGFVNMSGGLFWNVPGLYQSIVEGFWYFRNQGISIDSVGINTWGVDFVLLGQKNQPVTFPRCYRDPRNLQAYEAVSQILDPKTFYTMTGIQPAAINTVYQLYAAREDDGWDSASTFLFMPDYFCYLLSGVASTEPSVGSTSQLMCRDEMRMDQQILNRLQMGQLKLPEMLVGAQVRGTICGAFAQQIGMERIKLMNVNSHDTGSAMSFAQALGPEELLLNSGTYAILSAQQPSAVVSDLAYARGITNERFLDGTFRPAINYSNLFFINQCRAQWRLEGKDYSWDEIVAMAAEAFFDGICLDLNDSRLQAGGNMPQLICQQCRDQGRRIPETDGEVARLIYESIAAMTATYLRDYEAAVGKTYSVLNIVGGGSKNTYLNQLIADASGKTVRIGEAEVTALGNMLTQLEGAGLLSPSEKRNYMRSTFTDRIYTPRNMS